MLVVAGLFHRIKGVRVTLLLHGCVMARFDGEGFTACWNAPLDDADHEANACDAALEMLARTQVLNGELKREAEASGFSAGSLRAAGLDSANVWSYPDPDLEGVYRKGLTGWEVGSTGKEPLPGLFLTCTTLKDPSKRRGKDHTLEAFTFVHHDAFRRWAASRFNERPGDYAATKELLTQRMVDGIERIVPGTRRFQFRSPPP